MKMTMSPTLKLAFCSILLCLACKQPANFQSPDGYDLGKPVKYDVPANLSEISGIAFKKGNSDTIFAEEDEHGRVYYMKPGDKEAKFTEFKGSGDFEDIGIINNQAVLLESKGVLFTLPLSELSKPKADAKKIKNELPAGEYEGLYADEKESKVYVLCKHCSAEKTSKESGGSIFDMDAAGDLKQSGSFSINVKQIEDATGEDKVRFHPSALSRNPVTGEWFILSSVNRLLVVADEKWKVKNAYKLDPALFVQPEGMAFDAAGNLYISNEGQPLHAAEILKFEIKK